MKTVIKYLHSEYFGSVTMVNWWRYFFFFKSVNQFILRVIVASF